MKANNNNQIKTRGMQGWYYYCLLLYR